MSKRKDRERAINQGLIHRGGRLVVATAEKYPGDNGKDRQIFLRCTKCGNAVSDSLAEDHFRKCWGQKIPCERCGKWVPVAGCLKHWRTCKGKAKETVYED
jgi:ribosomal protein S26